MQRISEYTQSLSAVSRARYESKVTSTGLNTDPYAIDDSQWSTSPEAVPDLTWSDMVLYMISTPSPYTKEEIKAGWINSLKLHVFGAPDQPKFVVMGNVKHSQRMSDTPLNPWAILGMKGEILAAHCTCMAGLGEACCHIAAILSGLVNATEVRRNSGSDACTSRKCVWLPATQDVTPSYVKDITFISPANARKRLSQSINEIQQPQSPTTDKPSMLEVNKFFEEISKAKNKPSILKITTPYSEQFVPTSSISTFPKPITELYNPNALSWEYIDIVKECERVFSTLQMTSAEAEELEKATRTQSASKIWMKHRAGRITSSTFKDAAVTDPDMPSQSLIKRLCYPEAFSISTEATKWGSSNEKKAIEAYCQIATIRHQKLSVADCGLYVSTEWPYLGASPDATVTCECCGSGVLEVKCPYSLKDGLPEVLPHDSFLEMRSGKVTLKHNHAYYYQVQMQLTVCQASYCDFIVWTTSSLNVERIQQDTMFFQEKLEAVQRFFVYGVLPEIIGKWYTRKPVANSEGVVLDPNHLLIPQVTDYEDYTKLWCYCNTPSYGEMIKCENEECAIQWFHFDCLRIRSAPKSKWYCPTCRKHYKGNKRSKQLL